MQKVKFCHLLRNHCSIWKKSTRKGKALFDEMFIMILYNIELENGMNGRLMQIQIISMVK